VNTTGAQNLKEFNIGYFQGIYTCEILTFHLQSEKEVQFVSEKVCLHNASIP
jgi:hypothetical protein